MSDELAKQVVILRFVSETVFTINGIYNAENYSWQIYPAEAAAEINGNDTSVVVVWNQSYYMNYAWIKVKATNDCGESEFSDSLQVYIDIFHPVLC